MNAAPCSWRVRMKRISGVARSTSRIGRFIVPGMPKTWSTFSRRRQSTTACAPVIMGASSCVGAELLRYSRKLSRVSSPKGEIDESLAGGRDCAVPVGGGVGDAADRRRRAALRARGERRGAAGADRAAQPGAHLPGDRIVELRRLAQLA